MTSHNTPKTFYQRLDLVGTLLVLTGVMLAIFFISCEENKQTAKTSFRIVETTKSQPVTANFVINNKKFTTISYEYNGNSLRIIHANSAFSSCLTKSDAEIKISESKITIIQKEESDDCNYLELFDVVYLIENLEEKVYILEVCEIYAGENEEKLIFTLDLENKQTGSYMAKRSHYPWGM